MDKDTKKKPLIVLLFLLLLLLLAVLGTVIILLLQRNKGVEPAAQQASGPGAQYEANVILDDPESLQDLVDEMEKKAKEGQMALEMKTEAYSEDGETFKCYLGNPAKNSYEMYMILYLDETEEEIYRSGLIPLGGRIESFTTVKKIEPGVHECTLMYCQVEEDKVTIHSQVNVGLNLTVYKP